MDGSYKPAKLNPGHDVLHALEGLVCARTVIQQQQYSGEHLDNEQKESDAAEEILIREAVRGNGLVAQWSNEPFEIKPVIEPANDGGDHYYASRFRLTTTSSPRTWTSNTSSGLGGGPEILRPFRS